MGFNVVKYMHGAFTLQEGKTTDGKVIKSGELSVKSE